MTEVAPFDAAQLISAVHGDGGFSHEPGLTIYQHNRQMNAIRALEISMPTLATLLGSEGFGATVREYLRSNPPHSGDWGEWGGTLGDWIDAQEAFTTFPYLADCARLDWLCHLAMRAEDAHQNLSSLQLLSSTDAYSLSVTLNPALFLMKSEYPLHAIWQAHHAPDALRAEWIQAAQAEMGQRPHHIAVARPQWRAEPQAISAGDYDFLSSLQQGLSLGAALDNVAISSFSFSHWLQKAIQHQWLVEVATLPSTD